MTEFRWTLDHLETAERAFDRHREKVEAGECDTDCLMPEPACERGCGVCDLQCAVIVSGIEVTRRGLAEQARAGDEPWRMLHKGASYTGTIGNA